MPWRSDLAKRLPDYAREAVLTLSREEAGQIREVRFRIGCGIWANTGQNLVMLRPSLSQKDMDELLAALCAGAVYAHERTMAEGYIALPGGYRAGVCGRLSRDDCGNARMGSVTSVCIRIMRQINEASLPIRCHLMDERGRPVNALILGPPGSGKTTMLRDAAIWLSDGCGIQTSAADEREELFAGAACAGKAAGIDVLTGGKKAEMIGFLIRSMAPEVIVCDEIGGSDDAASILDAVKCGSALLTSAHADGIEAMNKRPLLRRLLEAEVFDRYIVLRGPGRIDGVYDGKMNRIDVGNVGTGGKEEKLNGA